MVETITKNDTAATAQPPLKPSAMTHLKSHLREYGILIALVLIMSLFQYLTDGTLMRPANLTNLFLQNSYIIIMAIGMLLVIVAGHITIYPHSWWSPSAWWLDSSLVAHRAIG